ncbi:MAG: DUF166 family protein [Nitrososphaerales archaeon]
MRIYIIYSGPYGEQIINNIAMKGLGDSIVNVYELSPEKLEEEYREEDNLWNKIWENPREYLPKSMPIIECDLLIILGIHGKLGDLVPYIAEELKAKAVLYVISDRNMIPEARKTIQEELQSRDIYIEFLEPFCSLISGKNEFVNEFAKLFGRPKFEIKLDREKGIIKDIKVIRDTPCGTASCVANKLIGLSYLNQLSFIKKIYDEHHNEGAENYCLAEMDPLYPLMQEATDLMKDEIFSACNFLTIKQAILSKVKEKGEISFEELKEALVGKAGDWSDPEKVCDADRTLNLYLDELLAEKKLLKKDGSFKLP